LPIALRRPSASAIEKPAIYKSEKVRGEVFRHFGYFMTETTGHLAEYVPWFRKSKAALDVYCDEPGFGGQSGAYFNWCTRFTLRGAKRLGSTKLGARAWIRLYHKQSQPNPVRYKQVQRRLHR
jgi:hypothetical protein